MVTPPRFVNKVRARRLDRGWSQEELARLAGLSRAGVSAVETGRLIPSTAAALALALAFGCRVEDLFQLGTDARHASAWAWAPPRSPWRYWSAEVGGRSLFYPVEPSPLGLVPHDGVLGDEDADDRGRLRPDRTLVMACCDPAVGLLAAELARAADIRLIVFPRSSRSALRLLARGLVHVAGVHLAESSEPGGNAASVRGELGGGFRLLHVARWEEGVTYSGGLRLPTIREAVDAGLRWVGREDGSGARRCLDALLGGRSTPARIAADHRGVAEAVRQGWADAGVCLRLASDEAGLEFLSVRQESYDLCYADDHGDDPRIVALLEAVRSRPYRRSLDDLPGYDSAETGEVERVD